MTYKKDRPQTVYGRRHFPDFVTGEYVKTEDMPEYRTAKHLQWFAQRHIENRQNILMERCLVLSGVAYALATNRALTADTLNRIYGAAVVLACDLAQRPMDIGEPKLNSVAWQLRIEDAMQTLDIPTSDGEQVAVDSLLFVLDDVAELQEQTY